MAVLKTVPSENIRQRNDRTSHGVRAGRYEDTFRIDTILPHQCKIIRTLSQSVKGSDFLFH